MTELRVDFPGLLIERHRNGSLRYRVRVEGNKSRRIPIPVAPDHPDFAHHYHSARAGELWQPKVTKHIERSIDWLCAAYLDFLEKMVSAGNMSPATLKQRKSVLSRLCDHLDEDGTRYGACDMDAPASAFIAIRDAWAAHPGAADNLIKSVRAVYAFATERGMIGHNPAAGIGAINTRPKGGAVAWSMADLKKFKDRHPKGTQAHLWLTLQAFTAGRIGDMLWLGREQEVTINGQIWLEWQPRKKGSSRVTIPMLPPLYEATRAVKVVGPSYLLNNKGKPYASVEALRVRVERWIAEAGLVNRSSHGIRKAMAEFLAESGCTQHQIMAVLSHSQAKTSEIYTKGAQRRVMGEIGMQALAGLDW